MMKKIFISSALLLMCIHFAFAQKQNFGVVNYAVPANFQLEKNDNVLTWYNQNKTTGAYCLFFIYNIQNGKGDVQQDFNAAWEKLVQQPNNITATAAMQPITKLKGWQFLIGNTNFKDKGVATAAMLCTFSGNNQSQSVLIMSNSSAYKSDMENFIASIDISNEISTTSKKQHTVVENNTKQSDGVSVAGDKSAYSITVPPTWSLNTTGNSLMLEKNTPVGKRTIEFMNMVKSSGNLENDMAHIFFEVFDGWELRIPQNSLLKEAELQKGLTCQGLNYYMLSTSIRKKSPNNDVIKATVLLIQAGDKVAIINSTDNILGSEVEMALNFLLFNLKIKGVAGKNIGYKDQLIGTWIFGSGMYGNSLNSATDYTAAGKYFVLLQSTTTVGYDYYNNLIKNKQFKAEGIFGFTGNVLERRASTGSISKSFIRFYSRKYGDFEWENSMSMYDYNYDKEKISSVFSFKKI